jgi:hypothetical protein
MNGKLWVDDSQVIELYAVKQWSNLDNGEGYFTLGVGEYNNE